MQGLLRATIPEYQALDGKMLKPPARLELATSRSTRPS